MPDSSDLIATEEDRAFITLRKENKFTHHINGERNLDSHMINLFQLGTDTDYKDDPEKPFGDTLCTMHDLIPGSIIVNGPKQNGSGCTNANAVPSHTVGMLLKEIANSKSPIQTLNISGHSRGSIGAVIIAAELDRIKEALTSYSSDKQPLVQGEFAQIKSNGPIPINEDNKTEKIAEICQSKDKETEEILKKELTQLGTEELNSLSKNIHDLRVNMFLLDPVPGNFTRDSSLPTTRWYPAQILGGEENNFIIPPIVKTAHIQYAQDERTHAFDCAVFTPQINTETTLTVDSLRGHHGTASGRLRDRAPKDSDRSFYNELTKIKIKLSSNPITNPNEVINEFKTLIKTKSSAQYFQYLLENSNKDSDGNPDTITTDDCLKLAETIIQDLAYIQFITAEHMVDFLYKNNAFEATSDQLTLNRDYPKKQEDQGATESQENKDYRQKLQDKFVEHIKGILQELQNCKGHEPHQECTRGRDQTTTTTPTRQARTKSQARPNSSSPTSTTSTDITKKLTTNESERLERYQRLTFLKTHFSSFRRTFYSGLERLSNENTLNGRQCVTGYKYSPLQNKVWLPSDNALFINIDHRSLTLRNLLSNTSESVEIKGIQNLKTTLVKKIAQITHRVDHFIAKPQDQRTTQENNGWLARLVGFFSTPIIVNDSPLKDHEQVFIQELLKSYLLEILLDNKEPEIQEFKGLLKTYPSLNSVNDKLFTSETTEKGTTNSKDAAAAAPAGAKVNFIAEIGESIAKEIIKEINQQITETITNYNNDFKVIVDDFEKYSIAYKKEIISFMLDEFDYISKHIDFITKNKLNISEEAQKSIDSFQSNYKSMIDFLESKEREIITTEEADIRANISEQWASSIAQAEAKAANERTKSAEAALAAAKAALAAAKTARTAAQTEAQAAEANAAAARDAQAKAEVEKDAAIAESNEAKKKATDAEASAANAQAEAQAVQAAAVAAINTLAVAELQIIQTNERVTINDEEAGAINNILRQMNAGISSISQAEAQAANQRAAAAEASAAAQDDLAAAEHRANAANVAAYKLEETANAARAAEAQANQRAENLANQLQQLEFAYQHKLVKQKLDTLSTRLYPNQGLDKINDLDALKTLCDKISKSHKTATTIRTIGVAGTVSFGIIASIGIGALTVSLVMIPGLNIFAIIGIGIAAGCTLLQGASAVTSIVAHKKAEDLASGKTKITVEPENKASAPIMQP